MGIVRRFAFEEVEGLRVGRFNLGLNTSAVLYRLGRSLIDTGPPNRWAPVREFLQTRPIERVLLTHHHEDHSGNAARIREDTGAEVLAHPLALSHLSRGWPLAPYQRWFWGRPGLLVAEAVPEEIPLEGGGRLQVLSTPGHAEDQVCYLEPDRGWLFTGDLFIASRPRYFRFDENLNRQIESLGRIMAHDFNVLFCGHRGVVTGAHQAIADKRDYLINLRGRAWRLRQKGWSVRRITRELLGYESLTSLATGYTFTKGNLIRACLTEQ